MCQQNSIQNLELNFAEGNTDTIPSGGMKYK